MLDRCGLEEREGVERMVGGSKNGRERRQNKGRERYGEEREKEEETRGTE